MDGKTSINPENFLPSLAEDFEVEDRGVSYIFKLRKDTKRYKALFSSIMSAAIRQVLLRKAFQEI